MMTTFGSWSEVLAGDIALAGAILGRLLHSATVMNILGRSYRLMDLKSQLCEQGQERRKPAWVTATYPVEGRTRVSAFRFAAFIGILATRECYSRKLPPDRKGSGSQRAMPQLEVVTPAEGRSV